MRACPCGGTGSHARTRVRKYTRRENVCLCRLDAYCICMDFPYVYAGMHMFMV